MITGLWNNSYDSSKKASDGKRKEMKWDESYQLYNLHLRITRVHVTLDMKSEFENVLLWKWKKTVFTYSQVKVTSISI